jgi:hypothetical protein
MYFQRTTTTAFFMTLLALGSTRADVLAEIKKSSNGKGKGLRGVADNISNTIIGDSNHPDDVDVDGSARILGSTQIVSHSISYGKNMNTEYPSNLKIQGSLYQNTGGSMKVDGDLTISDSFYKNSANICVNGDLIVSGDLYKNTGKIYVNGDLVVTRGEYYKNENVVVQGDIRVTYDDDFYRYKNTENELKGALTKDEFRSRYYNNC